MQLFSLVSASLAILGSGITATADGPRSECVGMYISAPGLSHEYSDAELVA